MTTIFHHRNTRELVIGWSRTLWPSVFGVENPDEQWIERNTFPGREHTYRGRINMGRPIYFEEVLKHASSRSGTTSFHISLSMGAFSKIAVFGLLISCATPDTSTPNEIILSAWINSIETARVLPLPWM